MSFSMNQEEKENHFFKRNRNERVRELKGIGDVIRKGFDSLSFSRNEIQTNLDVGSQRRLRTRLRTRLRRRNRSRD